MGGSRGREGWRLKSIDDKEICVATLRFVKYFCVIAFTAALGAGYGWESTVGAQEAPPVPPQDVQVLASGPIHEAFADGWVFHQT